MRARTAPQRTLLGAARAGVHVRAWLQDATGTMREASTWLGVDPVLSATVTDALDTPAAALSLALHPGRGTAGAQAALSPLVVGSAHNAGGRLLDVGRRVWLDAALTTPGTAPVEGDWLRLFAGIIDTLDVGDSAITLAARGLVSVLVDRTIETAIPLVTAGNTPRPLETVLADLLATAGDGVAPFPLLVPVSPAWGVKAPYTAKEGQSYWEAMQTLVRPTGWRLQWEWTGATTGGLVLRSVNRAPTAADDTLSADDVLDAEELALDRSRIRTFVQVKARDAAQPAPAPFITVTATSLAAQAAYGRRPMLLKDETVGQPMTSVQAQALADAILADLVQPSLALTVTTRLWWPWALGDVVDVGALPGRSDGTLRGAIARISHQFRGGTARTTLGLRGKPAATVEGWLALERRTTAADGPGLDAGTTGRVPTWNDTAGGGSVLGDSPIAVAADGSSIDMLAPLRIGSATQPQALQVFGPVRATDFILEGAGGSAGGGGPGAPVAIRDEGTEITPQVTSLNFTGPGVTATHGVGGAVTVNVSAVTSVAWGDVTGRPSTFPPSAHASAHAANGSDALSGTHGISITGNAATATSAAVATTAGSATTAAQLGGVAAANYARKDAGAGAQVFGAAVAAPELVGAVDPGGAEVLRVGGSGRIAVNLTVGSTPDQATATPNWLWLGNTYSNAPGQPSRAKIKLYDGGGGFVYGFGVSAQSFEYFAPPSGVHRFYLGTTLVAQVDGQGVAAPGYRFRDTRGAAAAVSAYAANALALDFKTGPELGMSGVDYAGVLTVRPWVDASGGGAHQLAFCSDGRVRYRYETASNTWGPWRPLVIGNVDGTVTAPDFKLGATPAGAGD